MKMIQMNVQGMSCENCVKHVTEALEGVEGVDAVSVNLEEGAATLNVGEAFTEQAAAQALDEAGYPMGEVQSW